MKPKAFTLFEMLLAMAMFVMAVGGLALAMDRIFSANVTMRRDGEVRQQLESWLDQAMVTPIQTLVEGSESEPDAMGATYKVTAEPAEIRNMEDQELGGLWWVTVRAEWTEGNEKQEWQEKFLRYQP